MAETREGVCSRCKQPIKDYAPPDDGVTAGYYDVTGGSWRRYANEGETILCDACMWADPLYQLERGVSNPTERPVNE